MLIGAHTLLLAGIRTEVFQLWKYLYRITQNLLSAEKEIFKHFKMIPQIILFCTTGKVPDKFL